MQEALLMRTSPFTLNILLKRDQLQAFSQHILIITKGMPNIYSFAIYIKIYTFLTWTVLSLHRKQQAQLVFEQPAGLTVCN